MSLTHVTTEQPILPPETSSPQAEIAAVQALVLRNPAHLTLSDGDEHTAVPAAVFAVLRQAVDALAHGRAVTVVPTGTLLTTQQAADVLGISRPTLVKILDAGDIPYMTPGRHRRIQLIEVLAYQQRSSAQTDHALDALMRDSAEYYSTAPVDDDHTTR